MVDIFDNTILCKTCNRKMEKTRVNKNGLEQIQNLLLEFGISSSIKSGYGAKRNVFAVITYNLRKFYNKIGFNLTRKQDILKSLV